MFCNCLVNELTLVLKSPKLTARNEPITKQESDLPTRGKAASERSQLCRWMAWCRHTFKQGHTYRWRY